MSNPTNTEHPKGVKPPMQQQITALVEAFRASAEEGGASYEEGLEAALSTLESLQALRRQAASLLSFAEERCHLDTGEAVRLLEAFERLGR